MTQAVPLVETTRGEFLETIHRGHCVIARKGGEIVEAWGDADKIVLPRSSAKMLQALPLVESGAAAGLSSMQLALACSSHSAEQRHIDLVESWLADIGLTHDDLACGPQPSRDEELHHAMIRDGRPVTRSFNWCSGKHSGYLTLARHLGATLDYVDPNHPVQLAVREAIEDMCNQQSPGFGIDGCSAPNFAVSLSGMARAMARFASSGTTSSTRDQAARRLCDAMIAHPELVAGKGRASTVLMQAAGGRAAIKDGADGFFAAIVPDLEVGIALKIEDGANAAAETVIAAVLTRLGVLDRNHPRVAAYLNRPILNWDGLQVGAGRPLPALL